MSSDCDQAVARIASSQFGVFHLDQAAQNGCTEKMRRLRLSGGRWERLYPHVYRIEGSPSSHAQDLVAAHLWVEGGAVFSHGTAAELHAFGLPKQESIEMTTLRHLRVRDERVRLHRRALLEPRDIVAKGKLRLTSVDLTVLDLAGRLTEADLGRLVDDVLRRRLCSLARLKWRLEQSGRRGRAGTAGLRAALASRLPGYRATDSVLEDAFLALCRRHGLPEPRRQVEVPGLGRVDFYYDARIVIELDGYEYHYDRGAFQRDRTRSNALGVGGELVLRYTHADVTTKAAQVASQVRAARRARGEGSARALSS
jgi:very-short-patch-repair endonuclease